MSWRAVSTKPLPSGLLTCSPSAPQQPRIRASGPCIDPPYLGTDEAQDEPHRGLAVLLGGRSEAGLGEGTYHQYLLFVFTGSIRSYHWG